MIRWLEDPSSLFPGEVGGHPCMNVTIRCGLRASGPGLGRDFWVQVGPQNRPSAWIMESGGHVWATLDHPDDQEAVRELAAFFRSRGFLRLETEPQVAAATGLPYVSLPVMECRNPLEVAIPQQFSCRKGSPRELISLLVASGVIPPSQSDAFYTARHLHLRRQNETILLGCLKQEVVACGVLGWGGGAEAVLSCIAVLPALRRKGFGLAITRFLAHDALSKGLRPFLLCREELEGFYRSAGFETHSRCAVLETSTK